MGKGGFEPPYHMDLIYSQARLTSYATSPVWAAHQVPPCLFVSLSFAEDFKDLVERHEPCFHSLPAAKDLQPAGFPMAPGIEPGPMDRQSMVLTD